MDRPATMLVPALPITSAPPAKPPPPSEPSLEWQQVIGATFLFLVSLLVIRRAKRQVVEGIRIEPGAVEMFMNPLHPSTSTPTAVEYVGYTVLKTHQLYDVEPYSQPRRPAESLHMQYTVLQGHQLFLVASDDNHANLPVPSQPSHLIPQPGNTYEEPHPYEYTSAAMDAPVYSVPIDHRTAMMGNARHSRV